MFAKEHIIYMNRAKVKLRNLIDYYILIANY